MDRGRAWTDGLGEGESMDWGEGAWTDGLGEGISGQ